MILDKNKFKTVLTSDRIVMGKIITKDGLEHEILVDINTIKENYPNANENELKIIIACIEENAKQQEPIRE